MRKGTDNAMFWNSGVSSGLGLQPAMPRVDCWLCAQGSLAAVLRPYVLPRMESGSAVHKASTF